MILAIQHLVREPVDWDFPEKIAEECAHDAHTRQT